jgi:hypothetical protein
LAVATRLLPVPTQLLPVPTQCFRVHHTRRTARHDRLTISELADTFSGLIGKRKRRQIAEKQLLRSLFRRASLPQHGVSSQIVRPMPPDPIQVNQTYPTNKPIQNRKQERPCQIK